MVHIEREMATKQDEEEQDNAKEFCEELRALVDVCEVRGCTRKRMGQALIGIGISNIADDNQNLERTKTETAAIMRAWFDLLKEED